MTLVATNSRGAATGRPGWQPWAWCNLARNPFGELTHAERVESAVVDLDETVSTLREALSTGSRLALQWIGRCGVGKTTRMLALASLLPDSQYVYLDEDGPCPPIPDAQPLLIDEAQRMPRSVRRCVLASRCTLVLATHRDLSRQLRRAGYRVCSERLGRIPEPKRVQEIANRRIHLCRLRAGPVPRFSRRDAEWLINRFGCDIRAMEDFLYEQVQKQAYGDGEMRFIG